MPKLIAIIKKRIKKRIKIIFLMMTVPRLPKETINAKPFHIPRYIPVIEKITKKTPKEKF